MPDRKVVIVDDEADVRLPLRRFLLGRGYAVLEAESVASLRALLGQESVDAAVVDFSLPDGDGLDVLRSVKAQDASVPVVLPGSGAKPAVVFGGASELPLVAADEPGDGSATVTDVEGAVWRSGSGAGCVVADAHTRGEADSARCSWRWDIAWRTTVGCSPT